MLNESGYASLAVALSALQSCSSCAKRRKLRSVTTNGHLILMRTRINLSLVLLGASLLGLASLAQRPAATSAPPYSPARKAGQTLYVSGQVARTPAGEEVRASVEAETKQVMENLGRVLKENGYSFEDV